MKRVVALLFTLTVLFGAGASAQSVDELIQKNIQAQGGLEKMKAIKSLRVTGKVHAEGMQIPLIIQFKRPGLVRAEATVQGLSMVKAYDGETAWQMDAFDGKPDPEKASEDETKSILDMGDLDGPLVDYKLKGNTVELIGKEELEATPVYKLKVTLKTGDVKFIYLDSQSYLALKMSTRRKEQGKEYLEDEYYSDYKPVSGVMMAHAIETRVDGQPEDQITFDKVEVNIAMDDVIFKMPKKAREKRP
jgi:outer membrane lipoprotein-sorting protein